MGIFKRISTVFKGYANSAVDSLEKPEIVLNQAIIDLEKAQREATGAVANSMAEQKRVESLLKKANDEVAKWDAGARQALAQGNEELALKCLQRKKENEALVVEYTEQVEEQTEQVKVLRESLTEIGNRISEAKRRKDTLIAKDKIASANEKVSKVMTKGFDNNVFDTLDRMEEKVESRSRRVDAVKELGKNDLESQLRDLNKGSASADLEALRAEMGLSNKEQ
jgi:phage shock protein A